MVVYGIINQINGCSILERENVMEDLLKIAICDDEKNALKQQYKIIKEILEEKNINFIIEVFESPVELLEGTTIYDILMLDIQMDDIDGIEAAKQIKKKNKDSIIIFVTNYDTYLDDAFDVHAFRFWRKPLDRHRLACGIDAALTELEKNRRFIIATKGLNKVKIMTQSIIYVYVVAKKVFVVTTKGEFAVSDSFESILGQLNKRADFFEPHRGYCVNFEYINNYDKDKIYCTFNDKSYEVYLSRRKYNTFRKNFIEWMGDAK